MALIARRPAGRETVCISGHESFELMVIFKIGSFVAWDKLRHSNTRMKQRNRSRIDL